jgi:hypothetical protein
MAASGIARAAQKIASFYDPLPQKAVKRAGIQFALPARSEHLQLGCIPFSPSGRFPAILFYASYLLSG